MTTQGVELRARLVDCFAVVFPSLTSEEIAVLDHATYDEWDSLASISLVTVIEEDFGIMLDDADIGRMTTFETSYEVLRELDGT